VDAGARVGVTGREIVERAPVVDVAAVEEVCDDLVAGEIEMAPVPEGT
jgi:hypothetical protein